MRLLWVLPYSPWPTTSGGKTRQYQLLRSLSERGHQITLLVQSKQPLTDADRAMLEPLLERLVVVQRRRLLSLKSLMVGLFSPTPLLASINGFAPQMQARFQALLNERWDVVQVEHSYSFEPLEKALKASKQAFVITEHNVESSLGAATYARFATWMRPFVWFDQWRYRRWERRVLTQAKQVLAVTEADAQQLQKICGREVGVVVNGVDYQHFCQVQPRLDAQRILFLGNYEYSPNVDAVCWALDEIMPLVWQCNAEARISICGYGLDPQWAQRWPDPRIEWLGFVADLPALQASASVFIAPLRHGGGSKLKVLEALAAGLPLVSTAQGVSGLQVASGVHYLAGETPEQLAHALLEVLDDAVLAQGLGQAGREYVRHTHDWHVAARQLETTYAKLVQPAAKEPACV